MSKQQFWLGAGLGTLLGVASVAVAAGWTALFGIRIELLGVRLAPQDFPTELRTALILLGMLGVACWLFSGLTLLWRLVRRPSQAAALDASPPMWYTGPPSIPHFTPPIPPPEAAYFNLSRPAPHTAQTRPTPLHLENTQVPSMPPLLSYESLFPSEQTAETPLPPPADSTPDAAPTVPPPQDS